MKRNVILGFVAATLVLAVALQFLDKLVPPPPPTKAGQLADLLPSSVDGWSSKDMPIAETDEMKAQVESRLVYDDYVVRLYERGGTAVMAYVAYWSPGKMPYRMVGAHSPDTCWVQNGWTRENRTQWTQCPNGDLLRQPIEWGTYSRPGSFQHVIFWHLVGGESYGFDQLGGHNIFGTFHDFKRFGLQQRREQYFIRISSNRPIDEIWADPGFQKVITAIGALGVPPGAPPLISKATAG